MRVSKQSVGIIFLKHFSRLKWKNPLVGFALNGINNVNIPMYERRFKLTSTQTGLEASFYDIIAGCSVCWRFYFLMNSIVGMHVGIILPFS